MESEPLRRRDLLEPFLRPYRSRPYSDLARLRVFVGIQLTLVAIILVMFAGWGWGTPYRLEVLAVELVVLVGFLVLVLVGRRSWAEGLNSLLLPVLFVWVVAVDPNVQANRLGPDLLLVYDLFVLILITLTTSQARWILAAGGIFLAGGLWFGLVVQPTVFSAALSRFVVLDVLAALALVSVQRIIRRANDLAEVARTRLEETNQTLEVTVATQSRRLQEALDQVRTAQRLLSEGDKLSTVGRFIAGVAHEINTPLAAIESSALSIQATLGSLKGLLFDEHRAWSSEETALLNQILGSSDLSGLVAASDQRRQTRRDLGTVRTAEGKALPSDLLDALAEWGVSRPEPRWVAFLGSDRGPAALELVSRIVVLHRSATIIGAASGKASVYVKELRHFIAKDRAALPPQGVSVTESLETFLLIYQNQLRGRIEVVRSYPEVDPQVLGHPDRLLQIWSNLISNAVGAMGDRGTLGLEVVQAGDRVEVRVSDDGPGIPEAVRDRIFEPFFSTKGTGEGMGLGLEIVRTIVDEHQGRITYETGSGGTVFTVDLPLWKARSSI